MASKLAKPPTKPARKPASKYKTTTNTTTVPPKPAEPQQTRTPPRNRPFPVR